ncbi:MAG: enoyl-CoA hydratase/isomerase family protein [Betaproteobacteria bacterium]|nr:enoyl-CoA hydratase/isomerase family protein [Betaproteobacteria bacterium]
MNQPPVLLESRDGVATITLNRPEKKNALDFPMREELARALDALSKDDSVRAVILTGAGGAFCAGGDISTMGGSDATAEAGLKRAKSVHRWLHTLIEFDRPVIAAVDGPAFGIGFSLALASDLVLASPRARFCLSFLRIGLIPDGGAHYTLPRVVGMQRAKELVFSARELDAATALEYGIVMEVVPGEALMERARSIASSFCNASGVALALSKATLNRSFESDLSTILELEAASQGVAFTSEVHRAAVKRFMDKQPPLFKWPARP